MDDFGSLVDIVRALVEETEKAISFEAMLERGNDAAVIVHINEVKAQYAYRTIHVALVESLTMGLMRMHDSIGPDRHCLPRAMQLMRMPLIRTVVKAHIAGLDPNADMLMVEQEWSALRKRCRIGLAMLDKARDSVLAHRLPMPIQMPTYRHLFELLACTRKVVQGLAGLVRISAVSFDAVAEIWSKRAARFWEGIVT